MALAVASLHVYPVKGLKGLDLGEAACTARGIEHDRRWMVVDAAGRFLSQREHPRMATVWTSLDDAALCLCAPDMPSVDVPLDPRPVTPLRVEVWNDACEALPVSPYADAWLSEYLGLPCRLVYMPDATRRQSPPRFAGEGQLVGFADAFAYLVTTEGSLADLNARLAGAGERAVPMNRFRPNIVVSGCDAFAEDGWKGLRIGEVELRAARPCGRCQVTTTDQATGERTGPEPLRTLASFRSHPEHGIRFGVNFVTARAGGIRVGDRVDVLE